MSNPNDGPNPDPHRSAGAGIGTVIQQALTHATNLIRGEMDLARAEIGENLRRAVIGIVLIVVSIILVMLSLNLLVGVLVAILVAAGLSPIWSATLVGVGIATLAIAFLLWGIRQLRLTKLAPTRAAENIKRDAAALRKGYNA